MKHSFSRKWEIFTRVINEIFFKSNEVGVCSNRPKNMTNKKRERKKTC